MSLQGPIGGKMSRSERRRSNGGEANRINGIGWRSAYLSGNHGSVGGFVPGLPPALLFGYLGEAS